MIPSVMAANVAVPSEVRGRTGEIMFPPVGVINKDDEVIEPGVSVSVVAEMEKWSGVSEVGRNVVGVLLVTLKMVEVERGRSVGKRVGGRGVDCVVGGCAVGGSTVGDIVGSSEEGGGIEGGSVVGNVAGGSVMEVVVVTVGGSGMELVVEGCSVGVMLEGGVMLVMLSVGDTVRRSVSVVPSSIVKNQGECSWPVEMKGEGPIRVLSCMSRLTGGMLMQNTMVSRGPPLYNYWRDWEGGVR